ncbi:MAG: hypothetical protein Q9P01_09010 [Anaerolineae bacterium]|nr:hypothetical protein [Anaerolineae bacterium]MDQ7034956.1 hypothetical protein [Anaerolineae bacterium]
MILNKLNEQQILLLKFWLPALLNTAIIWALLLLLGDTPLVRATGLALVIAGVTLALRRMGAVLSMIGGLTLALSPIFWSQTGGGVGTPATIVIALGAASAMVIVTIFISKRPSIGLGLGIIVFAALFISQVGLSRSIRLTGFVIGWLMYLLVDMLLLTNPRPDDAPLLLRTPHPKNPDGSELARPYHTLGILLLLGVGILNDPLLTLLAPSLGLSLYLTRTKLPIWYWVIFGIMTGYGLQSINVQYLEGQARFMMLGSWQDGQQWLDMLQLVISQFTILGLILGVLGLARLSRWYPPLGTVSLVGYGAYWIFGVVYTAPNRGLLLLPLFVIQVIWMSYAVLALSDWASRTLETYPTIGRYAILVLYGVLPASMLLRIMTT